MFFFCHHITSNFFIYLFFLHTCPEELEQDENDKNDAETSVERIYLKACKLVGVVPVSYFIRNLDSPTMTLSHHGIGPSGCEALAIALTVRMGSLLTFLICVSHKYSLKKSLSSFQSDTNINTLKLADNHIQAGGAQRLAEMLRVNFTIQHLVRQSKQWTTRGHNRFSSCVALAPSQSQLLLLL